MSFAVDKGLVFDENASSSSEDFFGFDEIPQKPNVTIQNRASPKEKHTKNRKTIQMAKRLRGNINTMTNRVPILKVCE